MAEPKPEPKVPWTRAQIGLILALTALLLAGIVGLMVRDRYGGPRLEEVMSADRLPPYRVDVNTAGAAELSLLPGIGPVRSQRIIAYRQQHGPFGAVDDLSHVPGLNARAVALLAPYAVAAHSSPDTDAQLLRAPATP